MGFPSDIATKANDILGNFQSSLVKSIEEITKSQMEACAIELKKLFEAEAEITRTKIYTRRSKQAKLSNELDTFYEEHVLSKINMAEEDGQSILKSLGTFNISEYDFVNIFKPQGWMSNWLVQALRIIWNREWGGEKVMFNISPVVSIN